MESVSGFDEATLLRLAGSLDGPVNTRWPQPSSRARSQRALHWVKPEDFASVTGRGVTGRVDGRQVALGNRRLLEESGVDTAPADPRGHLRAEGQTVMYLTIDGQAAGLLGVADPIKASTPEALKVLHEEGVQVVMLTGDNRTTAKAVADRLGISTVFRPRCCLNRRARSSGNCRPRAISWQWPVTALMMHPRWPRHMSASRWAQVPTSRWKARSYPRQEICAALRGRAGCRTRPCATSGRTSSSPSSTTRSVFPSPRALYPVFGLLLSPIIAPGGDELQPVSVIANALRLRRQVYEAGPVSGVPDFGQNVSGAEEQMSPDSPAAGAHLPVFWLWAAVYALPVYLVISGFSVWVFLRRRRHAPARGDWTGNAPA